MGFAATTAAGAGFGIVPIVPPACRWRPATPPPRWYPLDGANQLKTHTLADCHRDR